MLGDEIPGLGEECLRRRIAEMASGEVSGMTTAGGRVGAALVIGVGQYLHSEQVWPLRFATRDAEAVGGILIDAETCGFPSQRVKVLTDSDAGRDAVAQHLSKWLPEQARGAEIAVIYFAGHGTVHAVGRREEGYLLPYDADPEDLVTRGILMTDLAAGSRRSPLPRSWSAWTAATLPRSSRGADCRQEPPCGICESGRRCSSRWPAGGDI